MKNVKLFGLLCFSVLVLVGCNAVDANEEGVTLLDDLDPPEAVDFENQLDYFEAKLDYFANVVEILIAEAIEPDANPEIIRSESESLLEQIETERYNLSLYMSENFERFCAEDGGIIMEDYDPVWCDPGDGFISGNFERFSNLSFYGFEPLIPRTMAVEYLLFDSSDDFEDVLSKLESEISDFETEINVRLVYAEENETETWDLIQQGNLGWGHWEDLVTVYIDLLQRIEAINIGVEDKLDGSLIQRRLSELRGRLDDIVVYTFVTS